MLTPAQMIDLRAKCFADPTASSFFNATEGSVQALHAHLNSASAFIVWRTKVSQDEIMMNGFDWVQVDNLSVGKARIWEWLFDNAERVINPTKANVRAGISECWKGTTAMVAVRDAVMVHCKRAATIAEKLLGTGTGTTAEPGRMTFEGQIELTEASSLIYRDNGTLWTPQG